VQPVREPHPERINVINFWGRERKQIGRLFGRLGLEPHFIISFSSVAELSRISEAGATVMNCQTLGSYLGAGLEEHFGVPLVKSLPPHGIAGIESWLRELGKVVGKEDAVEELLAEERADIQPELDALREKLQGKRAYLAMGPGFGYGFIGVLQELGVEIVMATSWHYDQRHDHGGCPAATKKLACQQQSIPYSVNDHQNYEIIALLRDLQPDIYITRHVGTAVWAAKMGIPAMAILDEYAAFGYRGLINFGHRLLDTLANRAFAMRLAARVKMPYTAWWQQQPPFTFLEGTR
jgi:nitrogenase molybdenum-iron protein alpha chain